MHRQGEKGTVIGSRRRLGGAEVFFFGGGGMLSGWVPQSESKRRGLHGEVEWNAENLMGGKMREIRVRDQRGI